MSGALLEIVIAAVFASTVDELRTSAQFIETLNVLALIRIVTLGLMAACLLVREYKLRPVVPKSVPEERQSLLENGNGTVESYGSVHPGEKKRKTQVAGTGWLEYFAGFRVLFPYLWYLP